MVERVYKIKVQKIGIHKQLFFPRPKFKPMGESLYLQKLENTEKVLLNAPIPKIKLPEISSNRNSDEEDSEKSKYAKDMAVLGSDSSSNSGDSDDFELKEIEKYYAEQETKQYPDVDNPLSEASYGRSNEKDEVSSSSSSETTDKVDDRSEHGSDKQEKDNDEHQYEYVYPHQQQQEAETFEERESREKKEKIDLLADLNTVRTKYHHIHIPDFDEFTDLDTLKIYHTRVLNRIKLDANVVFLKKLLAGLILVTEIICVNFLNIDIQGVTEHQTENINVYEDLLYELGEKKNVNITRNWPVEIRLLGMVIMNCAAFWIQKKVANGDLSSFMNILKSFSQIQQIRSNPNMNKNNFSSNNHQQQQQQPQKPSNPMGGGGMANIIGNMFSNFGGTAGSGGTGGSGGSGNRTPPQNPSKGTKMQGPTLSINDIQKMTAMHSKNE